MGCRFHQVTTENVQMWLIAQMKAYDMQMKVCNLVHRTFLLSRSFKITLMCYYWKHNPIPFLSREVHKLGWICRQWGLYCIWVMGDWLTFWKVPHGKCGTSSAQLFRILWKVDNNSKKGKPRWFIAFSPTRLISSLHTCNPHWITSEYGGLFSEKLVWSVRYTNEYSNLKCTEITSLCSRS